MNVQIKVTKAEAVVVLVVVATGALKAICHAKFIYTHCLSVSVFKWHWCIADESQSLLFLLLLSLHLLRRMSTKQQAKKQSKTKGRGKGAGGTHILGRRP